MRSIIKQLNTRILITVFAAFAVISTYFTYTLYSSYIRSSETKMLSKLNSVSKTLALQLNGTILKYILESNPDKDDINTIYQEPFYREYHNLLKKAVELNDLKSDIYTLTLDTTSNRFFFGVSSSETPYFRHEYHHPPPVLFEQYNEGGMMQAYKDENGTWLSAFSPIKDPKGVTIAVLQVDYPFEEFIAEARMYLWQNLGVSLAIILTAGLFLYNFLRKILVEEENINNDLRLSNIMIKKKNEDITSSIQYAKKIQQSMLPGGNELKRIFQDSFLIFRPKDIVSGDFYWYREVHFLDRDYVYVAVSDCTGHGVPGALLSVLGHSFLNEIISKWPGITPDEVLNRLNQKIIESFSDGDKLISSKDGMDIALCLIEKSENTLHFAGAYRPLWIMENGKLNEIKGDKMPIGGDHHNIDRKFSLQTHHYNGDSWAYLFSDGYIDQFGGPKNKKFMNRRFKDVLNGHHGSDAETQKRALVHEHHAWKGELEQIDDICVIGIKL